MSTKNTSRRDRVALCIVVGLIVTALVCDTVRALVRHWKAKRTATKAKSGEQSK